MRYKATRDIILGPLRRTLSRGSVVEFDGTTLLAFGAETVYPDLSIMIDRKVLVPTEDEVSDPVFQGKPSKQGLGTLPKTKGEHVWGDPDPFDGEKTCRVCGVTLLPNLVMADRKGAKQFNYRDAQNQVITVLEELSCPVYNGSPNAAAATAKEHVRQVKGRVTKVESTLEVVDDRLLQLEIENQDLRNMLAQQQPVLTAELVADALMILAQRAGKASALDAELVKLLPEYFKAEQTSQEPELVYVDAALEEDR